MIDTEDPVDQLFQQCEGFDDLCIVTHRLYGDDGLSALMAGAADMLNQSDFMKAAAELRAASLDDIADLIEQAAVDVPERAEQNPFDPETDRANYRDWQRRTYQDFEGFMLNGYELALRVRQLRLGQ